MPKLRMLRGPQLGEEFDLSEDTIHIGRGRKNEIIIHDNEVSREHCRLVRVLDDYELHDLGSTNGTYVNGQRIDSRAWLLSSRQIIELGDSITLEYVPSEDVSATRGMVALDAEASFYLVIKRPPPLKARILPLRESSITVGRATDNDISINVPEMSRHHLRLVRRGSVYIAEDLNSTNGTVLNGVKLTEQHALEGGDTLQIGESLSIIFTEDPAHASRPPASMRPSIVTEAKTEQLGPEDIPAKPDKRRTTSLVNATSPLGVLAPDANLSGVGHGLEPDQLVDHVMVVYARTEWRSRASKVFTYLQDRHVRVWTDQYLLPSSQDWQIAFDQAMFECRALLVVLSKQSIVQEHVKRAIRYFQAKEKAIALLQYGDVAQKPIIIAHMDTIDFDEEYPANSYEQVIATIDRLAPISARPAPRAPERTDTPTSKPDEELEDVAEIVENESKVSTEPSSAVDEVRKSLNIKPLSPAEAVDGEKAEKAETEKVETKAETEETPSVKTPAREAKDALKALQQELDQLEAAMQERGSRPFGTGELKKGEQPTQTSEQVAVPEDTTNSASVAAADAEESLDATNNSRPGTESPSRPSTGSPADQDDVSSDSSASD
ncbi:FHA domain-containing protein [Phototrophicus methaneseepsis]|uniref:FHA domain-containing protein n=1 Tax=Phototrophicus methaneseepsis TaxID=2710758 RepID=A0A7S8EAU6_9CHLR|nr:FHA domain-containing protein [Phototrophicus methaneseepsis]QPC83464.1 FHA domain-containing protein [Phototrophicus methaneseepsis]